MVLFLMKKKLEKRHIIVLFLLLIPFWLIGISNYFFSSASFVREYVFNYDDSVNAFPENISFISGLEENGNVYNAVNGNPQIHVYTPHHAIASVRIALKEPVSESHMIKMFYSENHEDYNISKVAVGYIQSGESNLTINLPYKYYSGLRFDINIYNEEFGIEGIYLSQSSATTIRHRVGNYDGLFMTLAISIFITGLWITGIFTGYLNKCISRMSESLRRKINFIKENPGRVLLHAGLLIFICLAAVIAGIITSKDFSFRDILSFTNHMRAIFHVLLRAVFYITVAFSGYFIYVFRKKPEALFLSLSLLIGFCYVAVSPFMWFGWDNGVHYAWTVEESFIRTVSVSQADLMLVHSPEFFPFFDYFNDYDNAHEMSRLLTQGHENFTVYTFRKGTTTFSWSMIGVQFIYNRLAHIIPGLVTFISRSLVLPPVLTVKIGSMTNHIVYSLIIYFALKRLNSGKYLMAVIAMVPTAFALSTSFGYDHWLTAFFMLGFAYYLHEIQTPEKKIELKNLIIMVGAFVFALGTKEVYVPMMFVLFFIKKDKFKELKHYYRYITAVTGLIIFVFAVFLIPFVMSGGGDGDWRGESNVNAVGQMRFMFQNPFSYTMILLRFLVQYFNVFTNNYFTHFAHMGYTPFLLLLWILICFTALTDRKSCDDLTSTGKMKVLITFLGLSTVVLFSTAMYIGFTGVGEDTILGVQQRYKLPLLFPFIYVIAGFKLFNNFNRINEVFYSSAVFGVSSFVLLYGAWEKFLPRL